MKVLLLLFTVFANIVSGAQSDESTKPDGGSLFDRCIENRVTSNRKKDAVDCTRCREEAYRKCDRLLHEREIDSSLNCKSEADQANNQCFHDINPTCLGPGGQEVKVGYAICNNNGYEVCGIEGWHSEYCGNDEKCHQKVVGETPQCIPKGPPPECAHGSSRCKGSKIQQCSDNGRWTDEGGINCPLELRDAAAVCREEEDGLPKCIEPRGFCELGSASNKVILLRNESICFEGNQLTCRPNGLETIECGANRSCVGEPPNGRCQKKCGLHEHGDSYCDDDGHTVTCRSGKPVVEECPSHHRCQPQGPKSAACELITCEGQTIGSVYCSLPREVLECGPDGQPVPMKKCHSGQVCKESAIGAECVPVTCQLKGEDLPHGAARCLEDALGSRVVTCGSADPDGHGRLFPMPRCSWQQKCEEITSPTGGVIGAMCVLDRTKPPFKPSPNTLSAWPAIFTRPIPLPC